MPDPSHEIHTHDGGHDDLKPARWLASSPLVGDVAYGATEAEAVTALKATMARKYPEIRWFQTLINRRIF